VIIHEPRGNLETEAGYFKVRVLTECLSYKFFQVSDFNYIIMDSMTSLDMG